VTFIDDTHDPALRSWVPGADGHAVFPIQNLPHGVFVPKDPHPGPLPQRGLCGIGYGVAMGVAAEYFAGG
jgi:hypothetical protein